jgi:Transcription factor WhiB
VTTTSSTAADLAAVPLNVLEQTVLGLTTEDLGDGSDGDVPCRMVRVTAADDPWFAPEPIPAAREHRAAYERQARRLCAPCPIREACLELALRYEARGVGAWGVWGGTAPWTRRQLLRARRSTRGSAGGGRVGPAASQTDGAVA